MGVRLVAFDLDGTVTRGATICEGLAARLGRLERMREIEGMTSRTDIHAARYEMLEWYGPLPIEAPWDDLPGVALAPGAIAAFVALTARGVRTAIVSITWTFAVEAFARRFGADAWIGTDVTNTGGIIHFWPEDKPLWLKEYAAALGIGPDEVAAVGDSHGDVPMLAAVGHPVFVGADRPVAIAHAEHAPSGDLREVVERLLHVGG
jgi:HAD superfamily phosphoserine phosphatase-like hydrolase